MKVFKNTDLLDNPNYVKVVVNKKMNALFFSRSKIPFHRDAFIQPDYYEHIGVYAFRKDALLAFTNWEPTPLELIEKIECLRFLENDCTIKMITTKHEGVKIDVPNDLEIAKEYLSTLKAE